MQELLYKTNVRALPYPRGGDATLSRLGGGGDLMGRPTGESSRLRTCGVGDLPRGYREAGAR